MHQQFLLLSIQIDQWAHIFQELLRVTRPGGWIEIVDSDLFIHHAGPATQCMLEWHIKIYSYYGIDPRKYLYLESYLGQEKLVNLQTHMVKVPIGQWGGRIGKLALADFLALTTEFQPLVTTILAISAEEYDQTAQAMQREWEANGCFFTIGVTYGQQPFAE